MTRFFVIALLLATSLLGCQSQNTSEQTEQQDDSSLLITLNPQALHAIDDRIFGQFMEKASWGGEIGGDVVLDAQGQYRPGVLKLLKQMNSPIIRYPGGTDVDYYPWYNLIDNAPERAESQRPPYRNRRSKEVVSDNRLGLDEFLQLCHEINSEPLLVVNLGDAFHRNITIEQAAQRAADMVAYCNAKAGQELPEGMADWPAIRAKNGHPEPYKVRYFEIGNETWLFKDLPMRVTDTTLINHYMTCLEAIIDAMKAIDPQIEIITDGGIGEVSRLMRQRLGDKVDYLAYHPYLPWEIKAVVEGEDTIAVDSLSDEDIWKTWVTTPTIDSLTGMADFVVDDYYRHNYQTDYPIALTEWNWNGWWQSDLNKKAALDSRFAKAVGAAGFLHSMMRDTRVKIGCQSMMAGCSWGITAIRVDTTGQKEPEWFPTGHITAFYSEHHGDSLLDFDIQNMSYYRQPYTMNAIKAADKVAYVDIVATKDADKLYIHLINRSFAEDLPLRIDLKALNTGEQVKYLIFRETDNGLSEVAESKLEIEGNLLRVTLPKQSVSCLLIPLK